MRWIEIENVAPPEKLICLLVHFAACSWKWEGDCWQQCFRSAKLTFPLEGPSVVNQEIEEGSRLRTAAWVAEVICITTWQDADCASWRYKAVAEDLVSNLRRKIQKRDHSGCSDNDIVVLRKMRSLEARRWSRSSACMRWARLVSLGGRALVTGQRTLTKQYRLSQTQSSYGETRRSGIASNWCSGHAKQSRSRMKEIVVDKESQRVNEIFQA